MSPEGLRLRMSGHLSLGERGVEVADGHEVSHGRLVHSPGCAYESLQETDTCVRRTLSPSVSGFVCAGTRNERKGASGACRASGSTCLVEETLLYASLASI